MKKILQVIGLFTFICFSFFYTEKVITVINEQDPIMIKIIEHKEKYKINPIDAVIKQDTIIPGISGSIVNIDKSYQKMKEIGVYNDKLLIFDKINPSISINNNKDKYIIGGNDKNNKLSLLFLVNDDYNINNIIPVLDNKKINGTFFVSNKYLINNINVIYKIRNNHEIYNYGDNGTYKSENIFISNNYIERLSNNSSKYCLITEKNNDILKLCNDNDMFVIIPNEVISNNLSNEIKKNIGNGKIIALKSNNININELNNILDFIKQKGYKIVTLNNLLTE